MPAQLILEFDGVTPRDYEAVNAAHGIDPRIAAGDWPDGLMTHPAGLAPSSVTWIELIAHHQPNRQGSR